jgi:nucleoside-diphosphate-sugar epimerase
MIVGSGLIASELKREIYKFPANIAVYARGVSNSSEIDQECHNRDQLMLKSFLATLPAYTKIFYISSCSVLQPSSSNRSAYIASKLLCEQMVLDHENGFVVRLPQVAGSVVNPYNFCGHIAYKLRNKEVLTIHRFAKRNIIDIEHISLILSRIITTCSTIPKIFNIATPINFPVINFIAALEQRIGIECEKLIIDTGSLQLIDSSFSDCYAKELNINFSEDYPVNTMIKYYFQSE